MKNVLGQRRQKHGGMDFKYSVKGSHTDGHLSASSVPTGPFILGFVKPWIYSTLSLNVIGVLSDLGLRNEKDNKAVPFKRETQIEELR